MDLIKFFESEKIRIQDRHNKFVMLLHDYFGTFMKNARLEESNNKIDREILLKVKFADREKQLKDEDIFLGPRVEALMVNLNSLKKSWRRLGERFSNVMEIRLVPALLSEVTRLKAADGLADSDAMSVDAFFSSLSKEVNEDRIASYPLVVMLGSALNTIYNSSSPE